MDAMDSVDESYHDLIYMEMLKDICGDTQYHPNVNQREARYKICYCIRKRQSYLKGALKATQNMVKGLHVVFKTIVKEIYQEFPPFR